MVDEFWTSIKAYLYDRASSPLLGALIVGLLAWNLKIVMLFFSSTSYAVKVWEIDHFYSQTFFMFKTLGVEHWALNNYVFCVYVMPMVTAIFYIYVFPSFSHKVFEHSYNKQIALNNKRKELQGSEVLTQEEKADVLNKVEQMKLKNRKDNLDLRNEIADLESQLNTVVSEKGDVETSLNKIKNENEQLITDNKSLKEKLSFFEAIYQNDSEAQAQREAQGRKALDNLKEQFSHTSSSDGDVSANEDLEEPKINSIDFSFFYDANSSEQEIYKSILSALFLGNRTYGAFSHSRSQIDKYMPDLIMHDLVSQLGDNTFTLTDEGRLFFQKLKRFAS